MHISEFAAATGLTRDTIRFYIKRGLLTPVIGNGETNRYARFDAAQVERALLIRNAASLGFTLREIAALDAEANERGLTTSRKAAILRDRLAAIDAQAEKLFQLREYIAQKLSWLENGESGPIPVFGSELPRDASAAKRKHDRDDTVEFESRRMRASSM